MPTTDHYIALRQRLTPNPDLAVERASAEALDQTNPLDALSRAAFLGLLELLVTCRLAVHGRAHTKTAIQMRAGLSVLQEETAVESFDLSESAVWGWKALAELEMEPLAAFAYMRMVQELRELTTQLERKA